MNIRAELQEARERIRALTVQRDGARECLAVVEAKCADLERLVFVGGFAYPLLLVRTMHNWEARDARLGTEQTWSLGEGEIPDLPLPDDLRAAIDVLKRLGWPEQARAALAADKEAATCAKTGDVC